LTYPTTETVELFKHALEKDGMELIFENLFKDKKNFKMMPTLSLFKQMINNLLEDKLYEEVDGFCSGFVICLDLFRRQIEAEFITLEDVELQVQNMCGWTEYLERENLEIRNENIELTTRNKKLHKLLSLQNNGDESCTSRMVGIS